MENFIQFVCEHAFIAHLIIFLLLLLGGFNIPISEDILILTAGAIASMCIPEHTLYLFLWVYAGCCLSAWEAYWIGRYFGPYLYKMPFFSRAITETRIKKLHHYYEKFGVFTFIVGRFCPGGIRNGLFMTAGLGKMPFLSFILRDCFAASISVSTIFYIGFKTAIHYQTIINQVKKYDQIAIIALIALSSLLGLYFYIHSKIKKAL